MGYDYTGKVVVVMGGTSALGQAVVAAYLGAGAQVVYSDRKYPTHPASTEGTPNPLLLQANAVDEDSVAGFFRTVVTRFSGIDAVVNVIGGYQAGDPVSQLSLTDFEQQINLNLKTAFLITKFAVQAMEARNGGSIVHISSRAGVDNGKNAFAYSASKQGVLRLVEATAAEVKQKNITINAILPSIFDTAANRQSMPNANFDLWPKPEEIAKVILFLTSPDAQLINGAAIPVYGKA